MVGAPDGRFGLRAVHRGRFRSDDFGGVGVVGAEGGGEGVNDSAFDFVNGFLGEVFKL